MQRFARDRGFGLALASLYLLAMLFFSAFHLGGTSASASEGEGSFVGGLQLSICFGNGDAGGAGASACGLCSLSAQGFDGATAPGLSAVAGFAIVDKSEFSGPDRFGFDYRVPPLRGPPVLVV